MFINAGVLFSTKDFTEYEYVYVEMLAYEITLFYFRIRVAKLCMKPFNHRNALQTLKRFGHK